MIQKNDKTPKCQRQNPFVLKFFFLKPRRRQKVERKNGNNEKRSEYHENEQNNENKNIIDQALFCFFIHFVNLIGLKK
jgi:hypothetical protein